MQRAGVIALLWFLAAPCTAWAWTDARPAGLVTELTVDREGGATVTLRMHWRILAGRFRTFELDELPNDATLLEASAADATGNSVPVATRSPAAGRLEVTLGEDSGLRRGAIDVVVRYTTSLRAQGAIHREGDDAVLEIATIPWERGLEAAEIRVALPSSARRAEWRSDDTPGVDATVESELGRDVVHAIRRHLPGGIRWTGRVTCDAVLFSWLQATQRSTVISPRITRRASLPTYGVVAVFAAAFALSALLLRRRGTVRIVRLPTSLRWLPMILAAAGGAVQALVLTDLTGVVTLGALLIAAGFALLVPPLEDPPEVTNLPARLWPEERALATDEIVTGRSRSIAFMLALLVSAAVSVFAIVRKRPIAAVAGLDIALVALAAATIRRRLVPLRDARILAPVARYLARKLRLDALARPVWRVRGDGHAPGSIALRVLPRPGGRFVRGVRSIECSVNWMRGTLVWRGDPVLTVRIERGSALERPLRALALRIGTLANEADDGLAWSADMVGPGRREVIHALHVLVKRGVVRETERAQRIARANAPDVAVFT